MANIGQDMEESVSSQRENQFVNLECRRDKQHTISVVVESYHTEHTEWSRSKSRSHVSHDQETLKLQWEVDYLRRKLRHRKYDRKSPSSTSSEGSEGIHDCSYQQRSRTPPSKCYSAST